MHLAFLLLIILFIIFFVPLLALIQLVVRFISRIFFGIKEGAGNTFGRQEQSSRSQGERSTTWYTSTKKGKKKIDSSEGEYIDFEDIKE